MSRTIDQIIELNLAYQARLGWTAEGWIRTECLAPSEIPGKTIDAILRFQAAQSLTIDGICGPQTYRALLVEQIANATAIIGADAPIKLRLIAAGNRALAQAKLEWLAHVVDLPTDPFWRKRDMLVIDGMIRGTDGLNWSWEQPYTQNGAFAWCGAFAARAWQQIAMTWRLNGFASTYRLDRWARYLPINEATPNPKPVTEPHPREILFLDETSSPANAKFSDGSAPRAGDIVTMGSVDSAYGTHIGIIERVIDVNSMWTIEGNGTAYFPDGTKGHGIVRARRLVGLHGEPPQTYHIRRIIRPAWGDLT